MSANVSYNSQNYLAVRVWDHLRLGFSKNIQEHKENILEKAGNAGLWPLENLPRITWDVAKDPRVITVAATALAIVADSYLFYPEETSATVLAACALIPTIPFWAAKFAIYVQSVGVIASYGARAEGRYINKALMNEFYGIEKKAS